MAVAIGDVIALGQLAYTLYTKCYKVARGAPQEFQHLQSEVLMLSQAMKFLQEDLEKEDSTLMKAGESRIETVNEIIKRVGVTLREFEKHANRHEKLGDGSAKVKQMWRAVKWSVDAPDLDALRNQVIPGPPIDLLPAMLTSHSWFTTTGSSTSC